MHSQICLETLEQRLLLSAQVAPVTCNQLLADDGRIRLQYDMPALQVESVGPAETDDALSVATLGDAPLSAQFGKPLLPVVATQVVIPYGQQLAGLTVTGGQRVSLPGSYELALEQDPLLIAPDGDGDFVLHHTGLTIEASGLFDIVGIQRSRGVDILTVNLNPVDYNADTGQLAYYDGLTLDVSLTPAIGADADTIRFRPDDIRPLANEVDNPDALASYAQIDPPPAAPLSTGLCDPPDTYEYVVITAQEIVDATTDYTIHEFIAHKQAMGFSATVVTVEDIYATYSGIDAPEMIRTFITDAYSNWETDYVLLGGDINFIPVRMLYIHHPYWEPDYKQNFIASDMYYQCLDGDFNYDGDDYWGEATDGIGGMEIDFLPEVYIGRAPAETAEEMANWIYKTVTHELDVASEHRWNAAFVGEYMGHSGIGNWAKYKLEEIRLGADTHGYTTAGFASDDRWIAEYEDTLYERDLNDADVVDEDDRVSWLHYEVEDLLNSNTYSVIDHAGHAVAARIMKLVDDNILALTNDNFFFIYSGSCKPGKFFSDSVGEDFTTGSRNGAYAVLFNSSFGWSYHDSTTEGPSQHLNREFWDALFAEDITTLGAMNADSHVDSLSFAGVFAYRWVIMCTTLLGDPALSMTSEAFSLGSYNQPVRAILNDPFELALVARNGDGDYDWLLTGGALPAGLTLDPTTGLVTGTPTAPGEFTFAVQLTDGGGRSTESIYTIAVTAPLAITTAEIPAAAIGQPFSFTLEGIGGDAPYTWTPLHSLPDGLTLDSETGVLSGTPTDFGTWHFRIELRDGGSTGQVDRMLYIMDVDAPAPSVGGQVFHDANANGLRDGAETGLDGLTVQLVDPGTREVLAEQTTAGIDLDHNGAIDPQTEAGRYTFTGFAPGEVDVRVVSPANWVATTALDSGRVFALRGYASELRIDELDPATGQAVNTFAAPADTAHVGFQGLAVGSDRLFLVDDGDFDGQADIWELDINTGEVLDSNVMTAPAGALLMGVGVLNGLVYVQVTPTQMLVWDPAIDAVVDTLTVTDNVMGGLTGDDQASVLYAANGLGNILTINPDTGGVLVTAATGLGPLMGGLAYHNGHVLAAALGTETVYRIDPATGVVIDSFIVENDIDKPPYDVTGLAGDVTHTIRGAKRYILTWHDVIDSADLGLIPEAAASGQVFYDVNADGSAGPDDAGLNGVAVELLDPATGAVLVATVTGDVDIDGNGLIDPLTERGRFAFGGLLPGSYKLWFTPPSGYSQTSPVAPPTYCLVLAAGDSPADLNFGVSAGEALSVISGHLFEDIDFDGLYDAAEVGLSGSDLQLVDTATQRIVATTTTESGEFSFLGIAPGNYEIRLAHPLPWTATHPTGPMLVSVVGGQTITGLVLGAGRMSVVSGQVFEDFDGDGALGAGEVGLDGRAVELVDTATGMVVATSETTFVDLNADQFITDNERGHFTLYVTPGDYELRQLLADGHAHTSPFPATYTLGLAYGQDALDRSFGSALPNIISVQVFIDRTGNGSHHYQEDGIDGLTVELIRSATGETIASAVTASIDEDENGEIWPAYESGHVEFTGIAPGDYTLRLILPPGMQHTTDSDVQICLTADPLAPMAESFGVAIPATVSGQVFADANANGRQDPAELGLSGRTVELVDRDSGAVVASAVTGETGQYEFTGIEPGDYEVRQILPPGWQATAPTDGSRFFIATGNNTTELTIVELDPMTGIIRNSFDAPTPVELVQFQGMALGPGALYYLDSRGPEVDAMVLALDLDDGSVLWFDRIAGVVGAELIGAAYLNGDLFCQYDSNEIIRWSIAARSIVDRFTLDRAVSALTADNATGLLYGAAEGNALVVIDPATGAITSTTPFAVDMTYVGGLAFAGGELLVGPHITMLNTIYRVDPATGAVLGSYDLWDGPTAAMAGDGAPGGSATSYLLELLWDDHATDHNFGAFYPGGPLGDVNCDGSIDDLDIDLVFANVGPDGYLECDLDGNGHVDADDVAFLVRDILGTEFGDTNLDGRIDAADMMTMQAFFGHIDAGWAHADLNGDRVVNLTDLMVLRQYFGFTSSPEPTSATETPDTGVVSAGASLRFASDDAITLSTDEAPILAQDTPDAILSTGRPLSFPTKAPGGTSSSRTKQVGRRDRPAAFGPLLTTTIGDPISPRPAAIDMADILADIAPLNDVLADA